MKRSSLRRGKPIARRSRRQMRQRGRSAYAQRERGTDYMLAVKRLPCSALLLPGHVCDGPIEADHAGPRGIARKAHDSTVIALCKLAHQQRGDFSGPFRSWNQAKMRTFLIERVRWTQRYLTARGILPPKPDEAEALEIARWFGLSTADEVAEQQPTVFRIGMVFGRCADLREDGSREVGNVDVRHPDAAPLPVARVVSEGASK